MIIDSLREIVTKNRGANQLFLRNLLKEKLQLYVLNFIYTSDYAEQMLFKGGTCLRFCFDLPRLSEDLDLDVKNFSQFSLDRLVSDLGKYFKGQLQYKDLKIKIAGNRRQLFLRFPILAELGLKSDSSQSEILFLRLDLSPLDSRFFTQEVSLKSVDNFSFVIQRYSLSDLFASKIVAVLTRSFAKGKDNLITFKGRDYFDLIWFLEKKAQPNFDRLCDLLKIDDLGKILDLLDKKVAAVKEEYLKDDLLPLFADRKFVDSFVANFKKLYWEKRKEFAWTREKNRK